MRIYDRIVHLQLTKLASEELQTRRQESDPHFRPHNFYTGLWVVGRPQPTKLSFTHWSLWVAHIPQTLIHYIILNYFKRYLLAATPASVRSFLSFLSQPVLITHQQQLKHTISYSKRQSAWMETTSRKKIIVLISPHDTSLHHSHRSYLFWCTHPIKLFHFSDSLRFTFVLFFITLNISRKRLLVVTFALSFVFTESFYTKHIQKVSCPIFPCMISQQFSYLTSHSW